MMVKEDYLWTRSRNCVSARTQSFGDGPITEVYIVLIRLNARDDNSRAYTTNTDEE